MDSEKIIHVTDATFEKEVLSSKITVLVYCCELNSTSSMLYQIAKEYAGRLKAVQINLDENKITAAKYHIYNKPTFLIFINGIIVNKRLVQATTKDRLTAFINEHILLPEEKLAELRKKQEQADERRKEREQKEGEQRKKEEQKLAEWYTRQRKWEEEIEMLKVIENNKLLISAHGDNPGGILNSSYPFSCSKKIDPEYNPETKILIVDYFLPNKESMPTLKELKYIKKDQ